MEVVEKDIVLTEYNSAYTVEQIQDATGCKLLISEVLHAELLAICLRAEKKAQ